MPPVLAGVQQRRSLALAGNVTGRDAGLVSRLREAGAVILGKTNLSDLGLAPESTNYVVGAVQQLLEKETVEPSYVKPWGCSVKYAK